MIYRPEEDERLWDTWLFEWDGTVHLFYLASQDGQGRLGHCTSQDLVHWTRHEDLVLEHWPLTGMILRYRGRFLMPLGEIVDKVQTTTFYESDDLLRWRRLPPDQYRLRPRPPHYAPAPDAWRPTAWWRDPFVFRHPDDGRHHALVCAARPDGGPDDTGAVLAHVRTADFRRWEHLPPLDAPTGRFYHAEVPDLFRADGRWYVLFSTGSMHGLRINTPSRRETVGTYYMVADSLQGPYRLPEECLLVGAGYGRMSAYVGRTIELEGERLLYHQVRDHAPGAGWRATWGAPKRVDVQGDLLSARYWPGLSRLETEEVPVELSPQEGEAGWCAGDSGIVGRASALGISHAVARDLSDVNCECKVRSDGRGRCGVVLRATEEKGMLIALDFELGRAEIGLARRHPIAGWGLRRTGFMPGAGSHDDPCFTDGCRLPLEAGRHYGLRCLARAEHFEVYLDDRWLFTTALPGAPKSGAVELVTERCECEFTAPRLARLEPLHRTGHVGDSRPAL